ncbi:MAG: hypothetical protein U0Y68_18415 [Blastocatellia bacterium]
MNPTDITKLLQIIPLLAPEVARAIIALFQAPAMTKEELLSAAEDLDNQTLHFLEGELKK